jgi:hypothetical protein
MFPTITFHGCQAVEMPCKDIYVLKFGIFLVAAKLNDIYLFIYMLDINTYRISFIKNDL